ncbi:MAG: glycoside hydrolase domain-containing protein, partial [Candidatus Ratteibacteria bacterium]
MGQNKKIVCIFLLGLFLFNASYGWVLNKKIFIGFDFGDKKITPAENFLRISQDTIYDEKTGYGWENKYSSIYAVSTKDITARANQTGLIGTEQATLIVKLENGVYKGIITPAIVGKDITTLYRYSLLGNGETLIEKVDVPERTFTVKVTDGKLRLTFKPQEKGWTVYSIVLMPVDKFIKYPEEFEKAKRLLIIGDDEKTENLQIPELNYRQTPLPSFMKQDILIFKKSITDTIVPTSRPLQEELIKKIELTAAGDEYESYQFGILSKKPIVQLKFKVSDLKGKTTIPSTNITIRTQYYFTFKNFLKPKTLDLREEIELFPGYAQGMWLTAYIPPGTPEGVYKGYITCYGVNLKEIKMPVEVTVLPFDLPQLKRHFYNIMWLGTYDTNPASHAQEICKMAILDQKAHGINAFGCELRFPACNIYKEGNEIRFDLKPLEYRINFYKSLGIDLNKDGKFIWLIGIHPERVLAELTGTDTRILEKYVVEPLLFTDKFLDVYTRIVRAVEEYSKENNLPEMYLFNIDEPYGVYKNKVALQLLQATKKGGGHPWVTVNDTYYEPLKEYLDVPVFANGYASYKTYEEYRKLGKKFWFYSAAPRGLRPVYARYETGIYLYKMGFEGATWFVYSWSLGNAYNGLV